MVIEGNCSQVLLKKKTKFELMIKPNGVLKKKPKGRNAIPASNYIEKSL